MQSYEPNYEGSPVVAGPFGGKSSAHGTHSFAARAGHHLAPQAAVDGAQCVRAIGPRVSRCSRSTSAETACAALPRGSRGAVVAADRHRGHAAAKRARPTAHVSCWCGRISSSPGPATKRRRCSGAAAPRDRARVTCRTCLSSSAARRGRAAPSPRRRRARWRAPARWRPAAELGQREDRIGERLGAGRGGKHDVAVERGVHRIDGAGEAVCAMTARRLACALVRARRSRPRRGWCLAPARPWSGAPAPRRGNGCGKPRPPNSPFSLERRRPEMRAVADRDAADGVDGDERADGDAAARDRAEAEPRPPLRLTVVAPRPAPTLPSANLRPRSAAARVAEFAIGRIAAPVLVAAVEQVEQDRAGHDRHARRARRQSRGPARAARPARRRRHRARRPSRPTARWRRCRRRSAPDRAARSRACPGPPPRTSTARDRGSSNTTTVDAGGRARVLGMADAHARHVGDEVAHAPSRADALITSAPSTVTAGLASPQLRVAC